MHWWAVRVLHDESVPRQLVAKLSGHDVSTVQREGWSGLKNGALLKQAADRFDAFVTGDKNLEFQQNYAKFDLRIVVLIARDNRVETILELSDRILLALRDAQPGQVVRVTA